MKKYKFIADLVNAGCDFDKLSDESLRLINSITENGLEETEEHIDYYRDHMKKAAIKSLINSIDGLKIHVKSTDAEKNAYLLKLDKVLTTAAGYNFNEARCILASMVDKLYEEPGKDLYQKAMIALCNIEKFSDIDDNKDTIWELII